MTENKELKQMLNNSYFQGIRHVLDLLQNNYWETNPNASHIITLTREEWIELKNQALER